MIRGLRENALVFAVIALAFVSQGSLAQNAAVEAQSTAKIKKSAAKSWRIFGTMDHYFGVREGSETIGAFYFIGSNRFSWGSLQVFQPVIKYYEVDPGEPEVQAGDTGLRYFSNPYSFIDNWRFRYQVSATLPVSNFSREQGVITRPGAQAIFETSVGKAYFSIRPSFRYHVNQYTTTVAEQGDGGGRPLRLWRAGSAFLGVYSFTDKISAAASAGYFRIGYEQTEFVNDNPTLGYSNFAEHQYAMDLSLSVQIIPSLWSVTGGYAIDSTVERLGGLEIVAYDEDLSIWYLSTTATF